MEDLPEENKEEETKEEEEKQEPIVEIKASDIEGLDDIRIRAPFSVDGDWNDIELNYKKWR